MVKTFQAYLENCHRTYSCIHCRAHLANHDELISKSFQGSQGRAYLFNSVVNVGCGRAEERLLLTGLHAVADIFCESCKTTLGWKYEHAFESSQKYKEGKFIIELAHMIKENGWEVWLVVEDGICHYDWLDCSQVSRCFVPAFLPTISLSSLFLRSLLSLSMSLLIIAWWLNLNDNITNIIMEDHWRQGSRQWLNHVDRINYYHEWHWIVFNHDSEDETSISKPVSPSPVLFKQNNRMVVKSSLSVSLDLLYTLFFLVDHHPDVSTLVMFVYQEQESRDYYFSHNY